MSVSIGFWDLEHSGRPGHHYIRANVHQSLKKISWARTARMCPIACWVLGMQRWRGQSPCPQMISKPHQGWSFCFQRVMLFLSLMDNAFLNGLLCIESVWGQLVLSLLFLKVLATHTPWEDPMMPTESRRPLGRGKGSEWWSPAPRVVWRVRSTRRISLVITYESSQLVHW